MAAVRRLGQLHADLCAVEFRKHVVSCSSFYASENTIRDQHSFLLKCVSPESHNKTRKNVDLGYSAPPHSGNQAALLIERLIFHLGKRCENLTKHDFQGFVYRVDKFNSIC
jgi:hypothetical protein